MKILKLNYWFPIKAWLTTVVLIGPLILLSLGLFIESDRVIFQWSDMRIIPAIILYGLVFSIPTLLISYFIFLLLYNKGIQAIWIKIIISSIGAFGAFITIRLMGQGFISPTVYLTYSFAAIISTIPFNVYKSLEMDEMESHVTMKK